MDYKNMNIKNIKIKFKEGHLENITLFYNKKINKKQTKQTDKLVSLEINKENNSEKLHVINPRIDDELDILLNSILLKKT